LWFYRFVDPKGFRNLVKTSRRRDNFLLDNGFYSTQAWGALRKCWRGFKIAKSEIDTRDILYYAKGVRKFQRELNISVSEFPELGLIGRITSLETEEADSERSQRSGRSYAEIEREREQHELDLKTQEHIIETASDLSKQKEGFMKAERLQFLSPSRYECVDWPAVDKPRDETKIQDLQELKRLLSKYAQYQDQDPHSILAWAFLHPAFLEEKLEQLRNMESWNI
jgi:hypothetical protein